ncbi:beta-1,4-D-glucan cellobiohydrolase [Rhizoctonia solani]|uniref:Glucanase n=1 Tax=Rhizoctonia solani TaxID=456999 RepID=A0A8H8NM31_9AGAM|nr:beta-1,4-D-glucan cellobiohydrolase [Rhizoctonia solani]QRW15745.1 beta-1,4-D-glucan cellobiohydrolase [Rhizoctonia solani]
MHELSECTGYQPIQAVYNETLGPENDIVSALGTIANMNTALFILAFAPLCNPNVQSRGVVRPNLKARSSSTPTGAGSTTLAATPTAIPVKLGTRRFAPTLSSVLKAVRASGNSLTLKFVTKTDNTNIGSRVYLLADDTKYQMFKLKNQEFTFDVDVSNLPCGLNGALYFSQMDADGGMAKYSNNKAGAKYGTGYCDAQCPKDIKFINGEANVLDWKGSSNDANSGTGRYGTCCNEMDVWEANSVSTAYTPHPCNVQGQTRCSGSQCTSTCDQAGCDFNSYRMGVKNFYGKGLTVDTSKKMTVVTQFITADGTASGALKEIRRIYVQNGKVIQNSKTNISGMSAYDSITEPFCSAQKTAFSDTNTFSQMGGYTNMGKAFDAGMVLVLSIWDDHAANMLWLDSNYPTDRPASQPGVARGSCATTSGVPKDVETNSPNASVTFSNIKFGDLGSTYSA